MTELDESKTLKPTKSERRDKFDNLSGIEIKSLYTPEDIKDINYEMDLGAPGEYPFTRGAYPNMYRGRLWTMRQFAGFGTAAQTNERYKFLFEGHGNLV
jgi:methylmalonyl-CoA mutase N-terminal domain/subunit